ncbi:multidrug effflux MFS transporter [Rhizobium halophytocola]|uniref:Bcr/CflA family efflux transporter n=1 Tax=Rhizobium halophytocola TaxID=735519 RepID=A0ABS4DXY9_9HYPH|nr:multidrug effflux MFS transporter [Rhizobium halophytocola]MBP1850551.1 DHA1 family bicyclomycin/chloramphenicol resistance-like MFS transporter [Rhizobium halophytocola]
MYTRLLPLSAILGLLMAVGLFAVDMYLPVLPAIGEQLRADSHEVQASLISFFAAMALSQIFYGPLSDMFGRKRPLYFGLTLFVIGAIGCALTNDIEGLVAFRFLQGVGAAAGSVIARAVVRDCYTGVEAAQLMSRLLLIFSISPILAPLAGSAVSFFGSWRLIFWVMVVAAALGLAMCLFLLDETRPPEKRTESSLKATFAAFGTLLSDPYYLGLVMIAAFGMSSYMIYVANSSFVLIEHYGLSPTFYSVVFSVNAVAFIGASQLNGRLARRFGLRRLIRTAVIGYAAMMTGLFVVTSLGFTQLPVMAAFLFAGYGFLGCIIPTSAVLALETHGRIAGTASALMGTIQFIVAATVIGIGGRFVDGTSLPMIGIIALCSVTVLGFATVTLRRSGEIQPAE